MKAVDHLPKIRERLTAPFLAQRIISPETQKDHPRFKRRHFLHPPQSIRRRLPALSQILNLHPEFPPQHRRITIPLRRTKALRQTIPERHPRTVRARWIIRILRLAAEKHKSQSKYT